MLIVFAGFGFGHRAAAQAIRTAFERQCGNSIEALAINPLDDESAPWFLRGDSPWYDRSVTHSPRLYHLAYTIGERKAAAELADGVMLPLLARSLRKVLDGFRPHAVVITHPILTTPLAAVAALTGRRHATYVVVTDLTQVARLWFNPSAEMTFVASKETWRQGLRAGLPSSQLSITGVPIHPDFGRALRPPESARCDLGWAPDCLTVLCVGSARMSTLAETARSLDAAGLPIQLALVAGGDYSLYESFRSTRWQSPAYLYSRVDNMPTLMQASDLVISKAGGLITSEAIACGLPLILVDVIRGQESGNARHVVEHGAGELATGPADTVAILRRWLEHGGGELTARKHKARLLGRPQAALAIARTIESDLLFGRRWQGSGKRLVRMLSRMPRRLPATAPALPLAEITTHRPSATEKGSSRGAQAA